MRHQKKFHKVYLENNQDGSCFPLWMNLTAAWGEEDEVEDFFDFRRF